VAGCSDSTGIRSADLAALQFFILIDDTCDPSIGNSLNDLRDFINAQPATTAVGVGYMSNATIQIVQNFTADHALAAKAIRLPRGNLSAMDSPYLSLISAIKGWPEQKVRREVLMVSDGIDRLRNERMSNRQKLLVSAEPFKPIQELSVSSEGHLYWIGGCQVLESRRGSFVIISEDAGSKSLRSIHAIRICSFRFDHRNMLRLRMCGLLCSDA
jgi:hypothetical protein